MPNSKPKESYLHVKTSSDKASNQLTTNALQLIFDTKKYFYFI